MVVLVMTRLSGIANISGNGDGAADVDGMVTVLTVAVTVIVMMAITPKRALGRVSGEGARRIESAHKR